MTFFRILPTDPRLSSCAPELFDLAFSYQAATLSASEMRMLYRQKLQEEEEQDTSKFEAMGYSGEELDEILEGIHKSKTMR